MDTRVDWEQALVHEDLRFTRYGRPVSVLVVDVRPAGDTALDDAARRVGEIVRDLARAPDRVTRVSQGRFHVLLPETDEAAALSLGSRIGRAVRSASLDDGVGRRCEVVSAAAAPAHGSTMADALRLAQARVAE
jgi:GGDEF domain-containing protein